MSVVNVIIPTLNEELSIATVINDFRREVPSANIYVFDNVSSDRTVDIARAAGAHVITVPNRGKGNVIIRAFAELDGDVFVMVDGDGTYDSSVAQSMIGLVANDAVDMVVAERTLATNSVDQRVGHAAGNRLISGLVRVLFRVDTRDVLSGYRAFSRRFVKSFPGTATGFEIEVQMTAHAAIVAATVRTIEAAYRERQLLTNGRSKLRTIRDGLRILFAILRSYRQYAPTRFFGTGALLSFVTAAFALSNWPTDLQGQTAGLLMFVAGLILFSSGVVLTAITRIQRQQLRLAYLQYGATKK